jgi:heme exporter protein A
MTRLEVRDLEKSFGGPALFRGISLSAESGLVAVTGRNGSGKSTLLKIIAGLLRPSRGAVNLLRDGQSIAGAERRDAVGWASPEIEFPGELTALENLDLLRRSSGRDSNLPLARTLLDRLGLSHASNRPVGEFSSGMKQRLRLAFSLLLDPPVLLWDEPYSNLDQDGITAAAQTVADRRRDGLVILATNDRRDLREPDDEISLS